jgi:tetratricopeptide (TPR) repeat protein
MVKQARRLMDGGNLQGALGLLEKTLSLDPHHEEAKRLLSAARESLARQGFQRAMGRAISALAEGRYQEASKALSEARKIDPSDPALQKLALKLEQERRAARLAQLLSKARAAMEREGWKDAEGLYRLALQVAPDSVDAQDGLRLAKERAAIEDALSQIVSNPWSLNQPGPYSDAKKVVDRALSIQAPGPRLDRLIKQAQRTLILARQPVRVTFLSDGLTDIVIYRVGRLGMIKSRALKLLPGIYTVRGSRKGYRDVMKRLEIAPGSRPITLEIVCREKII